MARANIARTCIKSKSDITILDDFSVIQKVTVETASNSMLAIVT